jgi:5-bromo-4-chloroindolyl phosphate hydrolysis protein
VLRQVKIICFVILGMALWTLGAVVVLRLLNNSIVALIIYCLFANVVLDYVRDKVTARKITKNTEQLN